MRRQYEINYLDARKQMGKVLAERLFPKINSSNRTNKPAVEAKNTSETEG